MSDVVLLLLVAAIVLQIPVGVLVNFDAKRLGLKNPEKYAMGILLPTAGFVVIPYYFVERKNFPREEDGAG